MDRCDCAFHEDAVAVVVVDHQHVIIAGAGGNDELAGFVQMNMAEGRFEHGSKALVNTWLLGSFVGNASSGLRGLAVSRPRAVGAEVRKGFFVER
jgi:hypothetical protein